MNPFPNPPTPVESLMAPMAPDIVLQTVIDALVFVKIRADLWPTEGVMISAMTACAKVISGGINDRISATKSGWLPTATGGWQEWLALYMYGVFKKHGTFASGPLVLTNNKGASFTLAAFTVIFQNPTTKATYTNADPIALGPGPGTSITIGIQATKVGTASNSGPGEVTGIQTTMLGVTCVNIAPILGVDDQNENDLRLQCWNSIAANSPFGAARAIAYAIQTALNPATTPPSPVNINRYSPFASNHTGGLSIIIASPSGPPLASDVAAVGLNINRIATPPCVRIEVFGATPINDTDTITVYVTATPGLSSAKVKKAMQDALVGFFEEYPLGGRTIDGSTFWLFASAVDGVLFAAYPGVFAVAGTHDLAMLSGQVAVDETTLIVVLR